MAARDAVDDLDRGVLPVGLRPPVDRDGDAGLSLDEQVGELAHEVVGGSGDGADVGLGPSVDGGAAVLHPLEAVLADEGEPGEIDRPGEELDRTTADDGDGPESADERGERVAGGGEGARGRRVVDDRRDRAVEVDEHCGLSWSRRQRAQGRRQGHGSGATGRGGRRSSRSRSRATAGSRTARRWCRHPRRPGAGRPPSRSPACTAPPCPGARSCSRAE